jgi:ATP-dependent Clp protease ATP-binding subunit ClpA
MYITYRFDNTTYNFNSLHCFTKDWTKLESSSLIKLVKGDQITENKFIQIFSEKYKINFGLNTSILQNNLIHLEDILHTKIIGQNYLLKFY